MVSPRFGGLALALAAAATLVAELVRSDHSQEKYAAQLADVTASRGPELAAAALFLLAALLLIPAAIGIASLATGRGRGLITTGAALLGVAAIWLAAGRAMFCVMLYALTGRGVSTRTAVAALDAIGNSGAFAIFLVTLASLLLAPIVLALGLWRAGCSPWWLAPVWLAATISFLAVETSKVGDLVAFGMMMAVLAALGVTVARRSRGIGLPVPA
jgi:hypothetical protein